MRKKRTIVDFFENSQTRKEQDTELQLALELSKAEHIKEQKKLFDQIPTHHKKTMQEDQDTDDWFQTISSRPQLKKRRLIQIKKEAAREESPIEIEDLSAWLNDVKEEKTHQEKSIEIEDFSAFLEAEEEEETKDSSPLVINLTENSQPSFTCPLCSQLFVSQSLLDDHHGVCENTEIISDDDCSVIDLVDNSYEIHNLDNEEETFVVEEEDDGYLSPLEGFTNINEDRGEFTNYFEQLQQKPATPRKPRATKTRTRTSTSTSSGSTVKKKRSYFNKRWYYKKKNKK